MKIYDAEDDFGKLSHRYYTAAYPYYTRLTVLTSSMGKTGKTI